VVKELSLEVLGYFQLKNKKQEYQETLRLGKKFIHQRKKQFTSKWLKTYLKN
jgi:hypothetical protein